MVSYYRLHSLQLAKQPRERVCPLVYGTFRLVEDAKDFSLALLHCIVRYTMILASCLSIGLTALLLVVLICTVEFCCGGVAWYYDEFKTAE